MGDVPPRPLPRRELPGERGGEPGLELLDIGQRLPDPGARGFEEDLLLDPVGGGGGHDWGSEFWVLSAGFARATLWLHINACDRMRNPPVASSEGPPLDPLPGPLRHFVTSPHFHFLVNYFQLNGCLCRELHAERRIHAPPFDN